MSTPTIRVGTPPDAGAATALHRACWLESYSELCGEELVRAFASQEYGWLERWRDTLEHGTARHLAEHDGRLVGFSGAGPTSDEAPPAISQGRELHGLYVRAAWWGTGLADRLLDHALADQPAMLWVLEGNQRARRFYERHGFEVDGERFWFPPLQSWKARMVRGA